MKSWQLSKDILKDKEWCLYLLLRKKRPRNAVAENHTHLLSQSFCAQEASVLTTWQLASPSRGRVSKNVWTSLSKHHSVQSRVEFPPAVSSPSLRPVRLGS